MWPDLPRVSVDLTADGDLRPGLPIEIILTAQVREAFEGGMLRVDIPELEAARLSGFRERFDAPVGVQLPAAGTWALPSVAVGDTLKVSTTVVFPVPGYYRVIGVSHANRPGSAPEPGRVSDRYFLERWLLITETGGLFTDRFEPQRVPPDMLPVPGPFQPVPDVEEPPRQRAGIVDSFVALVKSLFLPSSDNVVYVKYWDVDLASYEYAVGVEGWGHLFQAPNWNQPLGSSGPHEVNDDGYYTLPCASGLFVWKAGASMDNAEARVRVYSGTSPFVQCADTADVILGAGGYEAFTNLTTMIPEIDDVVGQGRSQVDVRVGDPNSPCGTSSCYVSSSDRIYLTSNSAQNSPWTAAHEYGHGLHAVALGGLWSATNCNPHFVDEPSSYSCAALEGFADFVGNVGGGELGSMPFGPWSSFHEHFADSSGMVEGNVAALLDELTDTYGGPYAATVFETCATKTSGVGGWIDRWSVTQLVWCFENRTNSTVQATQFPGSVVWTDQTESAAEPMIWDADSIRVIWVAHVGDEH
jgi:hypothetical protein